METLSFVPTQRNSENSGLKGLNTEHLVLILIWLSFIGRSSNVITAQKRACPNAFFPSNFAADFIYFKVKVKHFSL
jgi:hypothetical protein